MNSDEIPQSLQYGVEVRRPGGGQVGNWAAYRMGNRIEVMGDFDGGVAVLKLPPAGRATRYLMGYRDYDLHTLRWRNPVSDTWKQLLPGGELALPSLVKKRLVFVELR